ncbi:MAG: cupin domain-containing protein [Chloroflexota bacterium]
MSVTVRRVVTGHDAFGKSIFISDGPAQQFHDRPSFVEVWNTAGAPAPITAGPGAEPNDRPLQIGPPALGSIVRVNEMLPGNRSPMHRTKTIDYGIVLEGEVHLVLEDSETLLRAGDIVIQRGTNHAWENRADIPAKMAFILIDAEFASDLQAALPDMRLMP